MTEKASVLEKCAQIKQSLGSLAYSFSKICYSKISSFLTDDVIKYLSYHTYRGISLCSIADRLERGGKQIFFERIYAVKDEISSRELMNLYYMDINGKTDIFEELKQAELTAADGKKSPDTVWTCPAVPRVKTLRISDAVMNAIAEDAAEIFAIYSDMVKQNISFSFLNVIFKHGAVNIFAYLLKYDLIPDRVIPRDVLTAYIVCHLKNSETLKFLQAVEKALPGYLKNFTDGCGRNLLWYPMYNDKCWNDDDNEVTQYLLSVGCNPDNTNALGISWRYCKVNMPVSYQKYSLLEKKRNMETKQLFETIRKFQGCSTPGGHIGNPKIIRFSRGKSRAPLLAEVKIQLGDLLRETFWNFAFAPDRTLPESWQEYVSRSSVSEIPADKLSALAKKAMRSYRHPDAHKSVELYDCKLTQIPAAERKKKNAVNDWGFDKAMEIMKTGLMLYNPLLRKYLLENQYDICKSLRFIDMAFDTEISDPSLAEAVRNDDAEKFAELLKGSDSISVNVVHAVLIGGKLNILVYMLDEIVNITSMYTPHELVLFAASQLDDTAGPAVLSELENRWPGVISRTVDCFGSKALYYAMFNKNIRWYASDCKLVKALDAASLNMSHSNKFGISVMDIMQILDEKDIAARNSYLKLTQK